MPESLMQMAGAPAGTGGAAVLGPLIAEVLGPATASILEAAGDAAGLPARAADRLNFREAARQSRLEHIVRLASKSITETKSEVRVENGWLIRFCDEAQDAAHEIEQSVWAGILAAEVNAPGTIARRTLSFVRDMDVWELESFAEYCAFSFAFESGWRFMFDEELARREMWTYGREIDLSQHWITISLLAPETARIESGAVRGLRIRYRERVWELQTGETPADPANTGETGVAYRKFTATGQQIAGVLKTKTFNGYARNLVNALNASRGMGFAPVEPPPEA
jgi:hypothetical protein